MHSRPTVITIDLDALAGNFAAIQQLAPYSIVMPIVKANAYGHGMVACAHKLQSAGVQFLGVAILEEGIELRQAGITIPIVVLGGILGSQIGLFLDYNLDITASSVFKLEAIEEVACQQGKRARIHLEIDTGMERIGVHYYSAHTLLERVLTLKHCDIIGISSHFATAEDTNSTFAREQLERFLECTRFFERHSLPMPLRHIAASGAILQLPESHLDMIRPGILLYGVSPAVHLNNIVHALTKPVMSLHSRIVYFKVVKKGSGISYGHTWTPENDTRIVTVPIGYGDGFSRSLGQGGASVLIRSNRYPVVGRVCMDQCMVNIGNDEAFNNDEVVLIGSQGPHTIRVEELASLLTDGNPREIMTSLTARIPRKYTEDFHHAKTFRHHGSIY